MTGSIGTVTDRGDCPGFNAVIGGTVRAEEMGWI